MSKLQRTHCSIHHVNDGNLIRRKHFNTCQPSHDCYPLSRPKSSPTAQKGTRQTSHVGKVLCPHVPSPPHRLQFVTVLVTMRRDRTKASGKPNGKHRCGGTHRISCNQYGRSTLIMWIFPKRIDAFRAGHVRVRLSGLDAAVSGLAATLPRHDVLGDGRDTLGTCSAHMDQPCADGPLIRYRRN